MLTLFTQLFARVGKPRDAEQVILEMQNAYLRANERTYGIIINGFIAAGLIEEALPLLDRMKIEGIPPTVAIFNHLVKGYSEAMQPEGIHKESISSSISTIISSRQTFVSMNSASSSFTFHA